jgi:hypothetical protein
MASRLICCCFVNKAKNEAPLIRFGEHAASLLKLRSVKLLPPLENARLREALEPIPSVK